MGLQPTMNSLPTPIFIFSLPRSGSTLLQRMLMTHPSIASAPEPWTALHAVYAFRDTGMISEYGHATFRKAQQGLIPLLPGGEKDLWQAARLSILHIYEKLAHGKPFFLDKTPPNCLIIPELISLFPDAKFIFLLRNPVAVVSSMLTEFRGGTTRRMDHIDLYLKDGAKALATHAGSMQGKAQLVTYEDLSTSPGEELQRLLGFIGLEYEPGQETKFFRQTLKGMGDKSGANKNTISLNADGWKRTMATPVRKRRLLQIIKDWPTPYFSAGGYDKAALLEEIPQIPVRKRAPEEWAYWAEEWLIRRLRKYVGKQAMH